LKKAGLVDQVRRGVLRITSEGQRVINEGPQQLDVAYLQRYESFADFVARKVKSDSTSESDDAVSDNSITPEESLENAYATLNRAVEDELLDQVKQISPEFFERLVVELLVAMGYGGSITDAGEAVGRSGDGGIDGIIKEDKLGLDLVVVQAKRYTDGIIGRPAIQGFAGSMEPHRAKKGVFITTSNFSKDAHEYVRQTERKIVLIDGPRLAKLMVEHNVGVTPYRTFVLKKIDADYFEE
jgi:restriction system protein